MKMNVRKWLSTVLAVTLVAVMLPLGAMPVAADITPSINLITNGSFEATGTHWETGEPEPDVYWERYQSTVISTAAASAGTNGAHLQGNGGWGGLLNTSVSVDPLSTYTLTFDYCQVSGNWVNFTVKGNSGTTYAKADRGFTGASGWQTYTATFTVGNENTLILNFNGGGAGVQENMYVDNFVMHRISKGVTNPVSNSGFETGDATGWNLSAAEITTEQVGSGSYALKGTTTIKYGTFATQNVAVKPNTQYMVVFLARLESASTQGEARLYVLGSDDSQLNGTYKFTTSTSSWTPCYTTFSSGDNTSVELAFKQGVANGGAVYYDDVAVIEVSGVTNGDFELGSAAWSKHQSTTMDSTAAYEGSLGAHLMGNSASWGGVLNQTINGLENGARYNITFWYKAVQQGVNFKLSGTTTETKLAYAYIDKKAWTQVSQDFTADDTSALLNFSCSGIGTSSSAYEAGIDEVYVDSIVITKYIDREPTTDGFIINGDFESGDLKDGWTVYGNYASLSKEAAVSGDFGVHLTHSGNGWVGLMAQAMATVEEGKAYRFSLDYRAITNGVNFRVVNGDEVVANEYMDTRTTTHVQKYFRATGPELNIAFVNAGNGVDANVFVDNVLIEEIPDYEVDIFTDTKKSAMEMNPALTGETAGRGGLAFLYTVDMSGAQVAAGNSSFDNSTGLVYQSESAIAHPYTNDLFNDPYDYKVVEVGAIVSLVHNNADDLTIESVTTDNKTIRIKGEKRWEVGENFYKYAVRVRNIPTNHFDTTVYIRPYAIVKTLNGTRQVTLYGDMQQSSYNQAIEEAAQ
ncbi:MAG: carbohydrate binding domain-containing protein [Clostridia bacterium]|nr:carbohydrate binding domain-containing protein [Clostridia bacterium]